MRKKTPRKRSESKAATREKLIDTGMTLFAKRGLDGPSLDDICEHAGFTRGAFYVHFKDRDDFMVAVMDRVGTRFIEELLASPGGGLEGLTGRFVKMSRTGKHPLMPAGGIRPYQLYDACARSPMLRDRFLGLVNLTLGRIGERVREGQASKVVRDDVGAEDVAVLAVCLSAGAQVMLDLGLQVKVENLAGLLMQVMAEGGRRH